VAEIACDVSGRQAEACRTVGLGGAVDCLPDRPREQICQGPCSALRPRRAAALNPLRIRALSVADLWGHSRDLAAFGLGPAPEAPSPALPAQPYPGAILVKPSVSALGYRRQQADTVLLKRHRGMPRPIRGPPRAPSCFRPRVSAQHGQGNRQEISDQVRKLVLQNARCETIISNRKRRRPGNAVLRPVIGLDAAVSAPREAAPPVLHFCSRRSGIT
jgi:hypothetical protein